VVNCSKCDSDKTHVIIDKLDVTDDKVVVFVECLDCDYHQVDLLPKNVLIPV
jgi:DNA-directed RNA polymerase subunit M/transcription elongation factor TFIIS